MISLNASQLRSLIKNHTSPCLSIYIPLEPDEAFNDLTFKELLFEAEDYLVDGYDRAFALKFLQDLRKLSPAALQRNSKAQTLALFKSQDFEGYTYLNERLASLVVVANSFHIKPLAERILEHDAFYVVDLHADEVVLYQGDELELHRLFSFSRADFQKSGLEWSRSYMKSRLQKLGQAPAVLNLFVRRFFNPQSDVAYLDSRKTKRFFKFVQSRLRLYLHDTTLPLILAGPADCVAMFKAADPKGRLFGDRMVGHLVDVLQEELHRKAQSVSRVHKRVAKKRAIERFRLEAEAGRTVSSLDEAVKNVALHKVKTLFALRDVHPWGKIDWKLGKASLQTLQRDARGDDVVDDLIERVILDKGDVYLVEPEEMGSMSPCHVILKDTRSLGLKRREL